MISLGFVDKEKKTQHNLCFENRRAS